jgi:hypothetical protein
MRYLCAGLTFFRHSGIPTFLFLTIVKNLLLKLAETFKLGKIEPISVVFMFKI